MGVYPQADEGQTNQDRADRNRDIPLLDAGHRLAFSPIIVVALAEPFWRRAEMTGG
jgi:hypothetical protein